MGVHRAPRSGWSSAWPFLLVAVVCAAVAWGGITLLSGDGGGAEASGDPSTSASAPASPSASASGESSGEPSGEPSGEASEPAGEEQSYPGDPAAAAMDAVIGVYNDSGQAGVANAIGTNLASAGFSGTINAGNAGDAGGPAAGAYAENTVLYGPGRADTASAVAQALDIPAANVQESAEVGAHPTEAVQVVIVTAPAG